MYVNNEADLNVAKREIQIAVSFSSVKRRPRRLTLIILEQSERA